MRSHTSFLLVLLFWLAIGVSAQEPQQNNSDLPLVYVTGAVIAEQALFCVPDLTLHRVIVMAGGPLRDAHSGNVQIFRRSNDGVNMMVIKADWNGINKRRLGDIPLRPFDIIYVPGKKAKKGDTSKSFLALPQIGRPSGDRMCPVNTAEFQQNKSDLPVVLAGEVQIEQVLFMTPGLTLDRALTKVGWPFMGAQDDNIQIFRRYADGNGLTVMTVDWNAIYQRRLDDVPLEPFDIVYVPSRKPKGDTETSRVLRPTEYTAAKPCLLVRGAVRSPGRFDLQRPLRLAEAIDLADGVNANATGTVQVVHAPVYKCGQLGGILMRMTSYRPPTPPPLPTHFYKLSDLQSEDEKANPYLESGDIVMVVDTPPVEVTGCVMRAQSVSLIGQMTLTEAIATAGKRFDADLKKVRIYRTNLETSNRTELWFDVEAIRKRQADDPVLQPFDVVEVSCSGRGPGLYHVWP